MNTRTIAKNLAVAIVLGLAGVATWAVTQTETPAVEIAITHSAHA